MSEFGHIEPLQEAAKIKTEVVFKRFTELQELWKPLQKWCHEEMKVIKWSDYEPRTIEGKDLEISIRKACPEKQRLIDSLDLYKDGKVNIAAYIDTCRILNLDSTNPSAV